MVSRLEQIITSRRTVHNFKPQPVPSQSLVVDGLEAARWAPNHHQNEPWHVYWPGPETSEAICQLNAELVARHKGDKAAENKVARWRSMPGWLVLTSELACDPVRAQENYAACCCLVQNLALYLWERGIGLKWSTGDVVRHRDFFELLHADIEHEQVVGLFWYGYPEAVPRMKRKPITMHMTELP